MQFDFRAIYGTLLEKWFLADDATAEAVLFKPFAPLPFVV